MNRGGNVILRTIAIWAALFLCMPITWAQQPEAPRVKTSIDWKAFLSRHDLIWSKLPTQWYQGPFLDNVREDAVAA